MMLPDKYPGTVLAIAIEPRTRSDMDRLRSALAALVEADPATSYTIDGESGQIILSTRDALQLRPVIRRLKREHDLKLAVGKPQVDYRETITRAVTHAFRHERRQAPAIQIAGVTFRFEPLPRGSGNVFINAVADADFAPFLPGVEDGLAQAIANGVIGGFPMIDLKATLIAVDINPVHSSAPAFALATIGCYRAAIPTAAPVLLEPIMAATITVGAEAVDDVTADLMLRRGVVVDTACDRGQAVLHARVPLANLMDYVDGKRPSNWPGFAIALTFDHFGEVPRAPKEDGPTSGVMALREGARLA
jgi:elongation factor G